MTGWFTAALLIAAAATAAWPGASALRRLQQPGPAPRRAVDLIAGIRSHLTPRTDGHPRRLAIVGVLAAAGVALVLGGPVAAAVIAVYAALAARAYVRRLRGRRAADLRTRGLDDLCSLAADLRAGLPPITAGTPTRRVADPRLAALTTAVWRLADRTGAPAADLIERIEADARAADRADASAAAEAAGAQATAVLLAVLPLAGIALGRGMGVNTLDVLLRTPLGAACALGAVVLQTGGLLWSERLVDGPAR